MPEMPNLDEIMKMAQDVQAEMQKAQENLDKVMRRVNDWISDGITKGAQSSIITLG